MKICVMNFVAVGVNDATSINAYADDTDDIFH